MTQIPSHFVGQLEITANCDLVAILHREPIMHEQTRTFAGSFESRAHWTSLTPQKAKELSKAIDQMADWLIDLNAKKCAQTSALREGNDA